MNLKSNFLIYCEIPNERLFANADYAESLGLPSPQFAVDRPALAVVGGGKSVLDHLEELKSWPGDIWACGSAFQWCRENGIKATFFLIDAMEDCAPLCEGAEHAIVCTYCDPAVFTALQNAGASVELFPLRHDEKESNHNCTTMSAAPVLSAEMGYRDVTFFGGDSSFKPFEATHVNRNDSKRMMLVRVGEDHFVTCPEFLIQAEFMATVIRLSKGAWKCRSGGLLAAMVADIDYDIVHYGEMRWAEAA